MFRRVMSIAAGLAFCFSCPGARAEAAVTSYRSANCGALCDLFSAFKNGLRNPAPAAQPGSAAPVPKARPRAATMARVRFYASKAIGDFYDLQGRQVSLGLSGAGSRDMAHRLLMRAGVSVREQPLDPDDAFDALSLGDIDALAVSGAKAYAMMDAIPAKYGIHRIHIPDRRDLEAHNRESRQTALLTAKRN